MEMTDRVRQYVRSLDAGKLSASQVSYLLELMLQLDPDCGPEPNTERGRQRAAQVFVRLMQGDPVPAATWHPKTWRQGHAR